MMKERQYTERRRNRLQRLPIVGELWLKGVPERIIREEVMKRLGLESLSPSTIRNDKRYLLEEWREERLANSGLVIERELKAIDQAINELWTQWEKSCKDYERVSRTIGGGDRGNSETVTNFTSFGDPRYIAEIRAQLQERRKLLGLYPAEKKEISGNISFAQALIESGMIDGDAPDDSAPEQTDDTDAEDSGEDG